MTAPHCAQLFGVSCLLISMFECSMDDFREVENARAFEKNVKATLGNETYFLGKLDAATFRYMSFSWARTGASAFKLYYTEPFANVTALLLKDIRVAVVNPLISAFKYMYEFADAMITPFGKVQCNLLPNVVSEHALIPPLSRTFFDVTLELMQARTRVNRGDFNNSKGWIALFGIRSACENFENIDNILGMANELIHPDCYYDNGTDRHVLLGTQSGFGTKIVTTKTGIESGDVVFSMLLRCCQENFQGYT